MDTCIGIAESFHSPPETITALLIGYASIQNKLLLKNFFNQIKINPLAQSQCQEAKDKDPPVP